MLCCIIRRRNARCVTDGDTLYEVSVQITAIGKSFQAGCRMTRDYTCWLWMAALKGIQGRHPRCRRRNSENIDSSRLQRTSHYPANSAADFFACGEHCT